MKSLRSLGCWIAVFFHCYGTFDKAEAALISDELEVLGITFDVELER